MLWKIATCIPITYFVNFGYCSSWMITTWTVHHKIAKETLVLSFSLYQCEELFFVSLIFVSLFVKTFIIDSFMSFTRYNLIHFVIFVMLWLQPICPLFCEQGLNSITMECGESSSQGQQHKVKWKQQRRMLCWCACYKGYMFIMKISFATTWSNGYHQS